MARKRKPHPLRWVVEDLTEDDSYYQKPMFGCEAVYLHGRMMVVLAARPRPPWQGVLLPLEREHHASILEEFPVLAPHPVLPKWLYLPERHDEFEEVVTQIAERIAANDPRFGIEPRAPRKRKRKRA